MSGDGGLVERLQRFGLSETEASVYLAVVERGRAEPSTIASDADVSASYVYQICDRLDRQGLVSVDDHRSPTVVRAHPPSDVLRRRVRELDDAVSEVEDRYRRPANDMDSLEVVRSRSTIYKRLRGRIKSADAEVFLTLSAEAVPEVADALRDTVDRGALVLLAVGGSLDEAFPDDPEGVATVVRSWVREMPAYLCVDQERGVIAPSSVLDWQHGDSQAIGFRNRSVAVAVEGSFLGTVWPASTEVLVRRPSPLPREYDSLHLAVYDATLHLYAGRPVRVRAEVRPVGTADELRTVTGTLADTRQSLVDPTTGGFAMENGLYVDADDGDRFSLGERGAFLEDYEAVRVSLSPG